MPRKLNIPLLVVAACAISASLTLNAHAKTKARVIQLEEIRIEERIPKPEVFYILSRAELPREAFSGLTGATAEAWRAYEALGLKLKARRKARVTALRALEARAEAEGAEHEAWRARRDKIYAEHRPSIDALEAQLRRAQDQLISLLKPSARSAVELLALGELEYQAARRRYSQALDAFDAALDRPSEGAPEPVEPRLNLDLAIAALTAAAKRSPDPGGVGDAARYTLAYCLDQAERREEAVLIWATLAANASGAFAAEAAFRLGEHHFDEGDLEGAIAAYKQASADPSAPLYDKALYKRAWSHYRLSGPDHPGALQEAVDAFAALLVSSGGRVPELRIEAIQYIAIAHTEEGWGTPDKLRASLARPSMKDHAREILNAYAEVLLNQARYAEAIPAYEEIARRWPTHPKLPRALQQIVIIHERTRRLDEALAARLRLTRALQAGSAWRAKHRDDPKALREADKLTRLALIDAALSQHSRAQVKKTRGEGEAAAELYRAAASLYAQHLQRYPSDPDAYHLTFYYAEALYHSGRHEAAAPIYERIRDWASEGKFKEEAIEAIEVIKARRAPPQAPPPAP